MLVFLAFFYYFAFVFVAFVDVDQAQGLNQQLAGQAFEVLDHDTLGLGHPDSALVALHAASRSISTATNALPIGGEHPRLLLKAADFSTIEEGEGTKPIEEECVMERRW